MKPCSTCGEEFADKFSFCPVDGMPLAVVAAVKSAGPAENRLLSKELTRIAGILRPLPAPFQLQMSTGTEQFAVGTNQ